MNPPPPSPRLAGSQALYEGRRLKPLAARWDAKAAAWERELQHPACHLNEDRAYARFLLQARRLIGQARDFCHRQGVIDAACGTGLVLAAVIGDFAWGVGVDLSPEMIRRAEAKRLPRARFILGDCFKLAALCPKAGAVFCRGVLLSHYGRRQGLCLLRAARAALVPGGFAAFDFLNQAARSLHPHSPENKTWFTRAQVMLLARRAGFASASVLGAEARRVLLLVARR